MKIGVNWSSSYNYEPVKQLLESNCAHFCELMVDNFLHFDPYEIKTLFPKTSFSFHILNSRFLERSLVELQFYADKILKFIEVLRPTYVSDHIGLYSTTEGQQFPASIEIDYSNSMEMAIDKITHWQQLLETRIYFENFPSLQPQTLVAPTFYQKIIEATQCGLLFDFSNAIVAEKNNTGNKAEWLPLAFKTNHFHMGGYRTLSSTPIKTFYMDTHDTPISEESLSFFADFLDEYSSCSNATIVIERDHNHNLLDWKKDINNIKQKLLAHSVKESHKNAA